jgi:hypothetical protein
VLHHTINTSATAYKKLFIDMAMEIANLISPWSWTDFLSEIDASSQKVETNSNE